MKDEGYKISYRYGGHLIIFDVVQWVDILADIAVTN
jgi:hypothetical protein